MTDITDILIKEHDLILRMITLLERNAPRTASGAYTNWQFYRDGIDFIRQYADHFHHAKEEEVLFTALIDNGMSKEHSPVAVMLMEHEQSRFHVRELEKALDEAQAGDTAKRLAVAEHALAYAHLLRSHIGKENTVLYPFAEQTLPETVRPGIVAAYRHKATHVPEHFSNRYQSVVEQYEQESD